MWTWKAETPFERPGRGPDLGREVREGRHVVAHEGTRCGEAVPGQLHPVAGVAGKSDDHLVKLGWYLLRSRCHALPHFALRATRTGLDSPVAAVDRLPFMIRRMSCSGVHPTPVPGPFPANVNTL